MEIILWYRMYIHNIIMYDTIVMMAFLHSPFRLRRPERNLFDNRQSETFGSVGAAPDHFSTYLKIPRLGT
jgi:hypothetical protein